MFNECIKSIDTILEQGKKVLEIINHDWKVIDDAIYKFVSDNKLIISDICLLCEGVKCSHLHVIYGPNIIVHANNLANTLASINIYTVLKGNIKNVDYLIDIEGRPYVQLYGMIDNMFSKIPVVKVNSVKNAPVGSFNLFCLRPELLYNPPKNVALTPEIVYCVFFSNSINGVLFQEAFEATVPSPLV